MISIKNEIIKKMFEEIESIQKEAFLIGGVVRDFLLGKSDECFDIDIITSAHPDEVEKILCKMGIENISTNFGCVNFRDGKYSIEITTFRKEGTYSDSRRPDKIEFCDDVHEDLKRRDFTINAIAYNKKQGFIDDFNGFYDIRNNILRCIGNPYERFNEDLLRVLRAMRFLSQHNLTAEQHTEEAVLYYAERVKDLSFERIMDEFCGIINGKNCVDVFLQFDKVIKNIIPELNFLSELKFDSGLSFYEFTALLITYLESEESKYYALFMLFDYGIFTGKINNDVLNFSTEELYKRYIIKREIKNGVLYMHKVANLMFGKTTDVKIKKAIPILGKYALNFIDVYSKFAFLLSMNSKTDLTENAEIFERRYNEIIANEECYSEKQLAVDGNILTENGYSGKEISKALKIALDGVINGEVENEKSAIIKYLKGKQNE